MPTLTVAFDLDGTLAETARDIVNALNAALRECGLPTVDSRRSLEFVAVAAGPRKLVERALHDAGLAHDVDAIERVVGRYLDLYYESLAVHTSLFPDCAGTLDSLRGQGYRLAVCTNKPERHAVALLAALGVDAHFAAIAGRDTFAFAKPDPRHLTETIVAAGGDPARAVMVGDSEMDILTAQAAGIPVIAVSFGYSEASVATFAPDDIVHAYSELPAAIERLAARFIA